VLDYHTQVDELVGRVFERFDREQRGAGGVDRDSGAGFYMLSDHGFCGIVQEVQLNAWLQQQGYLELEGMVDLAGITPGSTAFALDPGRIYIHRKGRFVRGTVEEPKVAAIKAEITEKLMSLEWSGERVVREVFDAEEIYAGPRVSRGPDLVVLARPGFDLKGSPQAREVFGHSGLTGMHTWDDAFLLSPQPVEGDDLWIGDVAGILAAELVGEAGRGATIEEIEE
jgi:predicted AlkP superfamily phosphohydrolase/phosphomutase